MDKIDELIKKNQLPFNNLIYLYLNKAPCADYNGNRKNCLERVIKWARNNPSRKLVLGFKKPYAIGSFTERGSWHRPDKVCNIFQIKPQVLLLPIAGYLASV